MELFTLRHRLYVVANLAHSRREEAATLVQHGTVLAFFHIIALPVAYGVTRKVPRSPVQQTKLQIEN